MRTPHFRVFVDDAKEFRWSLIAGNGEIVAVSEGYTTIQGVVRALSNVKQLAASAPLENLEAVRRALNAK